MQAKRSVSSKFFRESTNCPQLARASSQATRTARCACTSATPSSRMQLETLAASCFLRNPGQARLKSQSSVDQWLDIKRSFTLCQRAGTLPAGSTLSKTPEQPRFSETRTASTSTACLPLTRHASATRCRLTSAPHMATSSPETRK